MSPQTVKWVVRVAAVFSAAAAIENLLDRRFLAGASGLAFAVLWLAYPLAETPGSRGRKLKLGLISLCFVLLVANTWQHWFA